MQTKAILLSLAASAMAIRILPGPAAQKRALEPRQTADACYTAVSSLLETVPTMPPLVESFQATNTVTDPCQYTLSGSLSSVYYSYSSVIMDWFTTHSDDFSSAISKCPQYLTLLETDYNSACPTTTGQNTASGNTAATTTADTAATATGDASTAAASSAAATGSASASSANAGFRDSGLVAMAVVAAGVLGVAVAL